MKKQILYLFLVASASILAGCNKDEEDFYSTLGIISISDDSVIIDTDEGNRLLVSNRSSIISSIKDKDRVVADFTLVDKELPEGIDYVIDISYIEKVLFKPVIELKAANADSIGNDEIAVRSIWLGKDFLNLNFLYYGYDKTHLINLIRPEGEIPTDTIDLEIRHNDNDDLESYAFYAFVTFDLKSLQNNLADSVVLHVKAREYGNQVNSKYFVYKY